MKQDEKKAIDEEMNKKRNPFSNQMQGERVVEKMDFASFMSNQQRKHDKRKKK